MSGTQITQVEVFQQIPPTPSTLQKSGALISQGATNTSPGTYTLLTSSSSLSPIIQNGKAVTSITQTSGTATVTTTTAHGFLVGDSLWITIVGATPAAYSGTFYCTVTTTTAFTYAVPSGTTTPATGTITYTVEDVAELNQMVTTFFAQQGATNQAVWVLELGAGNAADGCPFLGTWIAANPDIFYLYVVPREWDAQPAYLTLLASYQSPTAKTYFLTTTTLATYQVYTAQMKDVLALIEAPAYGAWSANALTAVSYSAGGAPPPFAGVVTATTTAAHGIAVGQWFQISGCTPTGYNGWFQAQAGTTGSTLVYYSLTALTAESALGTLVVSYYSSGGIGSAEFSIAAIAFVILNNSPTGGNKVPPLNYAFLYGVTLFPTKGNSALITTLNTANVSIVGNAQIGGLSEAMVYGGNTMDGNQFLWWYSINWAQINGQLNLNNYVINGSNTKASPVYLNQSGINGGQAVIAQTFATGVTFGLALGTVTQTELDSATFAQELADGTFAGQIVVNAIPFADYFATNEGQYPKGIYNGYTCVYSPQVGFNSIVFTIIASGFAAG